ncbi:hypothetical protein ACA910_000815 [Epithemia clementina (nom. ined.)]
MPKPITLRKAGTPTDQEGDGGESRAAANNNKLPNNDGWRLANTPVKKFFPGQGWVMGTIVSSRMMRQNPDNGERRAHESTDPTDALYQVRYSNDFTEDYPHYVLLELIILALIEVGSHVVLYSYEIDRHFHAVVRAVDDTKTNNIHAAFETTRTDWIDLRRFKFQLIAPKKMPNVLLTDKISHLFYPPQKELTDQSTQTVVEERHERCTQTELERREDQSTQTEERKQLLQDQSTQTEEKKQDQFTQTMVEVGRDCSTQTDADNKQDQYTQTATEVRLEQATQTIDEVRLEQATQTIDEKKNRATQTIEKKLSQDQTTQTVDDKQTRWTQTLQHSRTAATQTPSESKNNQATQTLAKFGQNRATQTVVEAKIHQAVQTTAHDHQHNQATQTVTRGGVVKATQTILEEKKTQSTQTLVETKNTQATQTSLEVKENHTQTSLDVKENHTQTSPDVKENHTQTLLDVKENETQTSPDVKENETQTSPDVKENHAQTSPDVKENETQTSTDVKENNTQTSLEVQDNHTQTSLEVQDNHTQTLLGPRHHQTTQTVDDKKTQFTQTIDTRRTQSAQTQTMGDRKHQTTQTTSNGISMASQTTNDKQNRTTKTDENGTTQKARDTVHQATQTTEETRGIDQSSIGTQTDGVVGGGKRELAKPGGQDARNPLVEVATSADQTQDDVGDIADDELLDEDLEVDDDEEETPELDVTTTSAHDVVVFQSVDLTRTPKELEKSKSKDGAGPILVLKSPPLSSVHKNTRLAILWDQNDEYYAVKVLDVRKVKTRTTFHLEYTHDSFREWTVLANREFYVLDDFLAYESYLDSQRDGCLSSENIKKIKRDDEEGRMYGKQKHEWMREPFTRIELPMDKARSSDLQAAHRRTVKAVHKGCRVAVWWSHERRFYKGGVQNERTKKGTLLHQIHYDDGDKTWVNFEEQCFIILLPPEQGGEEGDDDSSDKKPAAKRGRKGRSDEMQETESQVDTPSEVEPLPAVEMPDMESVTIGSQVEVNVTQSRRFRSGVVKDIKPDEGLYFVEFEYGYAEWLALGKVEFRLAAPAPELVTSALAPEAQTSASTKRKRKSASGRASTGTRASASKRRSVESAASSAAEDKAETRSAAARSARKSEGAEVTQETKQKRASRI